MAGVHIQVDTREVSQALERLVRFGRRPDAALKDVGEYMQRSVDDRFISQTDPDGQAWAPNTAATLLRKRNPKVLHESTILRGSIHYQVSGGELRQGTPMIYGAVQQLGAGKGDFGKTSKGGPIPWGDIPARRFLGFSTGDRGEILRLLEEHGTGAWSGR
ncbi:phage virion morphogenesis protein [Natronospirillum operosum]|uniref:Phage virion morphogenesis protein n=1 Tax=Natronospirillum operosum TaxID=2759953 RepID=A0A4Z0WED8_9GAMM|nr:phage virion morphogenesis protein [Natronospirillum operosum]TGG92523.1 phage virion morphogenesis protein [Natronospirillum operosum]